MKGPLALAAAIIVSNSALALQNNRVALLADANLGDPARYGLAQLERALAGKGFQVERSAQAGSAKAGFLIRAGLCGGKGTAAPESLAVRNTKVDGVPAIVLCGADARGLMYAALDVADTFAASPRRAPQLPRISDAAETPFVFERGISMYTMNRRYFESRLYDERQWQRYFDLLAHSRINSFVVIFGYENGGFLAPVYPYFFDTKGFPDVRFTGLSPEGQQKNVAAFRAMIRAAHERGIEVTAAIWDHIYRGGVQGGGIEGADSTVGKALPWLVTGVTEQNLIPYTKASLSRFLEVFPELDALQFRMHGESGLKKEEMEGFWHDVFVSLRQSHPKLRLDLRVKELPDSIISDALTQGLSTRVSTKYWMEQMGLPYHPSHVNRENQKDRRHGYADLLRYPQTYRVHWQLWTGGTTRLLLWADPEYVRRFAASTRLYAGNSFEANEMLATKMLGDPHDAPPREILNAPYRYYDYEFERYWNFYQLWGRLSYNPGAAPELWEREYRRRFGDDAGPAVMQAVQLGSQVLPRIVAASYLYRNFPTTRGWAEMMSQGDLVQYSAMEGSDIEQFMNVRDRAKTILSGADVTMRTPEATSQWFAGIARRILQSVDAARKPAGGSANKELVSTLTDARILAGLARFHAHRLEAAVSYSLYKETGDLFSFDDAIASEGKAVAAWDEIVAAAGDIYSFDLAFGVHRVGFPRHWKEEADRLHAGLARLQEQRQQARPVSKASVIAHVPVRRTLPGEVVLIRATVASANAGTKLRVHWTPASGEERTLPMDPAAPGMFRAAIAPVALSGRVRYFIESSNPSARSEPVEILVSADRTAPQVELRPVSPAEPGKDLEIAAKVDDPSGVKSVRLRFRHVTQYEDYESAPMTFDAARGVYRAVIPGAFITQERDLMYFVEAVDKAGNGGIAPDLEREAPYRMVSLARPAARLP